MPNFKTKITSGLYVLFNKHESYFHFGMYRYKIGQDILIYPQFSLRTHFFQSFCSPWQDLSVLPHTRVRLRSS